MTDVDLFVGITALLGAIALALGTLVSALQQLVRWWRS